MNDNLLPLESGAPRIIKRKNQKSASIVFGNLIKHQILSAEEKAVSMIETARENAAGIVDHAEQSAEEIRRQAYQMGREAAENELLANLLAIKEERSQALFAIEQDVIKLSVKLAEKIIGQEVKQDESVRTEIVMNALRQARQQEMLTVHVNANDLPLLEQMREKINSFGRAKYIDFIADQAVATGGCIIESQSGTIDARLETQLRILENALLAKVSNETRKD